MICSNGNKYVKNLDIVRKCGCTKKCYWLQDAATPDSTENPEENENENLKDESSKIITPEKLLLLFDEDDDVSENIEENKTQLSDVKININLKTNLEDSDEELDDEEIDDDEDDDEDDDDYEDDDENIKEQLKEIKKQEDEDDFIFSSHRNHYRRKNDAIKIVSTPHGKVGIVYQAKTTDELQKDHDTKTISSESQQKVTAVRTADGKVALLYRGAVSFDNNFNSTKYEPIKNLNNSLIINNNSRENKTEFLKVNNEKLNQVDVVEEIMTTTESNIIDETTNHVQNKILKKDNEEENSILPNIDRPLSEVLGIKKNQFTSFRITDSTTIVTVKPDETTVKIKSDVSNYEYEDGLDEQDYDDDDQEIIKETTTIEIDETSIVDDISTKSELINLAIIPSFDNNDVYDISNKKNHHSHKNGGHYRSRNRQNDDLSGIHCAMQAMVAVAAMATVFGILGAYFKTRILDQLTIMHW